MSATVGTRELKTHLGRYLRLVKSGRTLVITDRGRPVAEIRPIARDSDDEAAVLRDLAAMGRVTLGNGEPFAPFRPVRLRGGSLSETIVEDREDRV